MSESFTVVAAQTASWARDEGRAATRLKNEQDGRFRGAVMAFHGGGFFSVVYTTAAGIQPDRRISESRITTFALGVVAGKGRWCLSVGACLIPTALDTWPVKGHVRSLDDGPIDQNGEKLERTREIFRLGQKCLLALPSSLLFAHRRAVSIARGGMSAGKTAHPQPRQQHARLIHDRTER
jgi:hypothetical protein